jgi:DHA1 family tetracycline resistance protein-like MFS transporter
LPAVPRRRPLPPGFGVIWTTVALDLVGFGMLFPVLARYSEDLGASPTEAGLLVASFSLAQLVCSPLSGRLSDRIGRKPVLLASLIGTAIGSLLTGLAGSLWVLFAARLLDGASGASVSVAQAAVTDVATPEERPRLLGLLGAAFGVGFALGPAIGGIAALVDHRLPFFVAAAIAGVNALVAVKRLPETHPPEARHPRTGGPGPVDDRTAAPSSGFRPLLVASFLGLVAFSAFEATFSLLAEARFGLTESSTYAVFFAIGVVLVVVQGGAIHTVVARLGEAASIRFGFAANAIGLLLLAPPEGGWWLLVPALLLLCVGQGVLAPTLASAVAGRAGRSGRGQALGLQQAAGGLARVAGPALGGALFEHVSAAAPYYVGAALVTVALAGVGRAGSEPVHSPVTAR